MKYASKTGYKTIEKLQTEYTHREILIQINLEIGH
jgi:hypothetical protein